MAYIACKCVHPFQDRKYGSGIRVANVVGKASSPTWKCTVCGTSSSKTVNPTRRADK